MLVVTDFGVFLVLATGGNDDGDGDGPFQLPKNTVHMFSAHSVR